MYRVRTALWVVRTRYIGPCGAYIRCFLYALFARIEFFVLAGLFIEIQACAFGIKADHVIGLRIAGDRAEVGGKLTNGQWVGNLTILYCLICLDQSLLFKDFRR